jgi:hypothetical protein
LSTDVLSPNVLSGNPILCNEVGNENVDRKGDGKVPNPHNSRIIIVPDRRCRSGPKVVLVRRWVIGVTGKWRGEGWVRGGQFTSNRETRWTDPVTARRVSSKWKGGKKRNQQGEIIARGVRHVQSYRYPHCKLSSCVVYIIECLQ